MIVLAQRRLDAGRGRDSSKNCETFEVLGYV